LVNKYGLKGVVNAFDINESRLYKVQHQVNEIRKSLDFIHADTASSATRLVSQPPDEYVRRSKRTKLISGDKKSIGGSDVSLQNECNITQPPSSERIETLKIEQMKKMVRTHRAALDFDQRFCNIVLNKQSQKWGRCGNNHILRKEIY